MDTIPPDLQLVPGWIQEHEEEEFSFMKEYTFSEKQESVGFISSLLFVNKLNTNIDAVAKDLSRVQVRVKPSMDKINYKTCILAMMEVEELYLANIQVA